ncbi:MAG TPA: protein kinase [Thermoanaerobaculia bacterium]|nr:protein kinase [Thermoanaerobaculia bacterium]
MIAAVRATSMMGAPQPHELSPAAAVKTLAVTDLVDSTGLFARLGDRRAAEISARHERLARDLLVRCSGREIDKTDGFLTLFDRAIDAVRFALAYHRALAELAREEGVEIEARVGIHLGEVILRANPPEDVARGAKPVEIEGYAKPIAARVMALAEGRQTLLTRAAFDLARQAAAREPVAEGQLRWLAHGAYVLKGVAEPVEVFEVGETGFAPLLVPKSTAKARRAVAAGDEITLGWRPAPGLEVPRRPHWRLAEKLGEGGFGEVWRAAHEKTGENRVFKFCYQPDRLRSLKREVTLFRLLKETLGSRRDIARILDWSFDEAPYFLECEYTEGGNLLEWAAEQGGPAEVPLATKLELVAQVAEALAAAHSVGVLHKDVKPSNVLVTTGPDGRPEVRLTDFGIGLVTDREVLASRGITVFDLTEMVAESTGSAGGTHLYMAPELVEGRTATVQADIYALGVMLYQFVAGDFTRALAPGWRRDVPDELLQEDVAALVDGRPDRRMRDAQRVAERLRTLEERRARREAERRQAEAREAERQALERALRRRKLALAAAGVSIAVLLVVSFLAIQAIDARREAERRRGQAEGLIGFMVGDLREKLEPIGRLDLLDAVGDQALAYFEAVPEEELTDEELFQRSQALYQIGDVRASSGDLELAARAYEQSLDLAGELTRRDGTNLEWQKGLGASHFGVGLVLWRQGELDAALVQFRSYLQIAEGLVAAEPDNPDWQLELAYAESNIASVHEAKGDLEQAEAALRRSLAARARLVERDPANSAWRRGLAVAHNKLGAVLEAGGRPEEALEHFEADLRLTEGLVVESPADSHLLRRQAVAESFVGYVLEHTGRPDQALRHYSESRRILERLAGADASNLIWAHDLALQIMQQASALRKTGDAAEALSSLRSSVGMIEELVDRNPEDLRWRRDLAHGRLELAALLLDLGRLDESRELVPSTLTALEELAGPLAGDQEIVVLTSRAHRLLGDLRDALSEPEMARRSWSTAFELLAPQGATSVDRRLLEERALAGFRLGRLDEAADALARLTRMGYRDDELLALAGRAGLESSP